jgi:flagellar motor switch protein FliG
VGSLGRLLSAKVRPSLQRSGGAASVASILNQLDKDTSTSLLNKIEERNAALAAAVRRKMFSFDDLIRLSGHDLQKIMRQAASADLALAMKTASPALKEKLFAALSKRAAENLRDEIQLLGATKMKDVESAQDRIIQGVRQLEEAGEVVLDPEGAEALVA